MLDLIEKVVVLVMAIYAGYRFPQSTLKFALILFAGCMLAVPLDYLIYSFTGLPFFPHNLKDSFAVNLLLYGITLFGLGLGEILHHKFSNPTQKERKENVLHSK